jgi:hypothetical protein
MAPNHEAPKQKWTGRFSRSRTSKRRNEMFPLRISKWLCKRNGNVDAVSSCRYFDFSVLLSHNGGDCSPHARYGEKAAQFPDDFSLQNLLQSALRKHVTSLELHFMSPHNFEQEGVRSRRSSSIRIGSHQQIDSTMQEKLNRPQVRIVCYRPF